MLARFLRVRIAWVMVAVAIAAFDFGAIRARLDSPRNSPLDGNIGFLLLGGALPMANVLAVGVLSGPRRPRSRPFFLGFEAFGAIALALFIAVAICFPHEIACTYLLLFLEPLMGIIGSGRPFVDDAIGIFGVLVLLSGPQLAFALIGGFLSRRFIIITTPR